MTFLATPTLPGLVEEPRPNGPFVSIYRGYLPLGQIQFYQDDFFRQSRSRNIRNRWEVTILDELLVGFRPIPGEYHCTEGNHRGEALKELFGSGELIPVRVFISRGRDHELEIAERLHDRGSRRTYSINEKFAKGVEWKSPTILHILAICAARNLVVAISPDRRSTDGIRALAKLYRIYTRYGAADLELVIGILSDAFMVDYAGFTGEFLLAVHALVKFWRGRLYAKRLSITLRDFQIGNIVTLSKTLAGKQAQELAAAMADIIAERYLEQWPDTGLEKFDSKLLKGKRGAPPAKADDAPRREDEPA